MTLNDRMQAVQNDINNSFAVAKELWYRDDRDDEDIRCKRECAYAHALRMIDALTLLRFDYVMVYEGPTVYERRVTDIQW